MAHRHAASVLRRALAAAASSPGAEPAMLQCAAQQPLRTLLLSSCLAPLPLALWTQQHAPTHSFSSSSGSGGGRPSSGDDDDAIVQQMEQVLSVMMQNPAIRDMMLARLPPHMQRPEVLRAMLANPDVRMRVAALARDQGIAGMFANLDAAKMQQGLQATMDAGLDPAAIVARFQQSPSLATAMQNPRVMAALMDMASNGADALKQYEGDKEVIEAAMEAGDILQQLQQSRGSSVSSPGSSAGASSSSGSSAAGASGPLGALEQQLGVKPEQLMQRLMARPDLLAKIQDPEVHAALVEVSQKPWKLVKYLFNSKVMAAVKDMKGLLQEPSR